MMSLKYANNYIKKGILSLGRYEVKYLDTDGKEATNTLVEYTG